MICSYSHYLQSLAREVVSKLASEALSLSFRTGKEAGTWHSHRASVLLL